MYGFLITTELIFGFQILDLKDHFSTSSKQSNLEGVAKSKLTQKSFPQYMKKREMT